MCVMLGQAKLLPGLKAELKAKLLTDAREHVATQCGNELWKLLQPGPYKAGPTSLSILYLLNALCKMLHAFQYSASMPAYADDLAHATDSVQAAPMHDTIRPALSHSCSCQCHLLWQAASSVTHDTA